MEATRRTSSASPLLTIRQFAHFVGLSERSVWAHIAAGRVTAIRLGPRTTRVEQAELERFISDAKAGKAS